MSGGGDAGLGPLRRRDEGRPFPVHARLRAESPVHSVERFDCWALSRSEDVWNGAATESRSLRGAGPAYALEELEIVPERLQFVADYDSVPIQAGVC